jgi:hypothetical protein
MSTVWNAETLVGARLGSCQLERPLGVGGMGAVYLARQERPHRQVAVKVLRPEVGAGPRERALFLARFQREADATAGLDHANIVPIYEFGEQDGIAYLVMPYLGSGSLADLLERRGPLPLERALSYIAQAAAALDYAHAHGIIHRDVKPSNLLLHPDGRLLLADFGIARPLDRADLPPTGSESQDDTPTLTRGGLVLGTPEYMAPEQIEGASVGTAADVYALGALAYTLLAGHPPFEGEMGDVLRRQLGEPPPPLRVLRPDVPPQAEAAILRALAKPPEDRPRNAGSFARLLLGGSPTGAGARSAHATGQHAATGHLTPLPAGEGSHDTPTIYDGAWARPSAPPAPSGSAGAGGPPFWPGGGSGGRPGPDEPGSISRTALTAAVAGALFLALLVGLLSGQALFSQSTARGQAPGTGTHGAATASATATTTPTPSPTPVEDWLRLSPSSVSLACHGGGRSARVKLKNLGSDTTDWQASGDQTFGGILVQPNQGTLDAGQSVDVTITNNSFSFTNQSGTIQFIPSAAGSGNPAALTYTVQACSTGG